MSEPLPGLDLRALTPWFAMHVAEPETELTAERRSPAASRI
ncbi:MAG: hypothetical protein QM809_14860 [Gordonia sp. (in: high G+C Gram-positive bacteria)]